MENELPVVEISGRFADEFVAGEVADALNRWFHWIVNGSEKPVPEFFEPLGVETVRWAWALREDVDWEVGPHARCLGEEVRISVLTRDTYLRLSGLLRQMGAHTTRVVRDH